MMKMGDYSNGMNGAGMGGMGGEDDDEFGGVRLSINLRLILIFCMRAVFIYR